MATRQITHTCAKNISRIFHGKIVTGCEACIERVQPNELAAQHKRAYQQREYARDISQPFERDYVKAVGIDKAREMGWDDASIRKYG